MCSRKVVIVRSREEILERIDFLAQEAEEYRRRALNQSAPQDFQIRCFDKAKMCGVVITELRWVLGEETD